MDESKAQLLFTRLPLRLLCVNCSCGVYIALLEPGGQALTVIAACGAAAGLQNLTPRSAQWAENDASAATAKHDNQNDGHERGHITGNNSNNVSVDKQAAIKSGADGSGLDAEQERYSSTVHSSRQWQSSTARSSKTGALLAKVAFAAVHRGTAVALAGTLNSVETWENDAPPHERLVHCAT